MLKTTLNLYNNNWYKPGAIKMVRAMWFLMNALFLNSYLYLPFSRHSLLRLFGAKIGRNVILKPKINIKYPWNISIGDNSWIGEEVWLDSLGKIEIGNNVCISQGAMLLCGNHNYKKSSFDLIVKNIVLEDGVWIGAKAIICPGVHCGSHSVLSVGSVAVNSLDEYSIYQGNPAIKKCNRTILS